MTSPRVDPVAEELREVAVKKRCTVGGCGKPHHARGWCGKHWYRWWKHGDPLGGRTPDGEPMRYLRETVLACAGDDCLIWPYARSGNGRGVILQDGKSANVHRLVCEAVNGPPPALDHEAAHSCGNGDEACVNPRHLLWKTHKENMADRDQHGTTARGERIGVAKLTEPDVHEIRALKGQMTQQAIADRFGVATTTIRDIHTSKRWAWLEEASC